MIRKLPFLFLFITSGLFAQNTEFFEPDSIKKEIHAVPITSYLHINGLLNEPEWELTKPSPEFIQIEPHQNKKPTYETHVKVVYNRRYLYFGIVAHDSSGKKTIRATDFKRDFDSRQHDLVSLAFDAFNDKRNAMSFVSNAYGVQRDLLSFDDLYYDIDWNGLWQVRTNRTDTGWAAEIAIPWQTLRYPKTTDTIQSWGFNVYRNRRLTNEITAFSPYPRSFTSLRMDYAGILTNLRPPPPKSNIRIQPYVLTSYDRYHGYDSSIKPKTTSSKIGGEVKWAISPNAVLDVTANTDFAQVDADQQVNNVTRFSVFFPEKRQFFLENASLFGVGVAPMDDGSGGSMRLQPFFSRRIGLDDNGNSIPIDAGSRFVYRSSKINYGAIVMRQRQEGNAPATNFFVGRFSENFGAQNRVGGLMTVKNSAKGTNVVSTIDGFFRLGGSHSLNTMVMHSTSTNTGKQGFAGVAQYYYSTLKTKIWWVQSVVTKNFNPEAGFVSRTDVIGTTPGANWYYRGKLLPFKKIIRAFEPGFTPEFYHQASTGKWLERQLMVFPLWINFQSGAYIGYTVNRTFQRLIEPFQPLGVTIKMDDYNYTRQGFWFSSDPSKTVNLFGTFYWGNYFNGKLTSTDVQMQFAPIPHISITAHFNRNQFFNVGQMQTTAIIDLYSLQARLALNPRVQLTAFYQKNSENSSHNHNIRFSWEYKPLSYIYLVYNHIGFNTLQRQKLYEDHIIAKVSYLKQF